MLFLVDLFFCEESGLFFFSTQVTDTINKVFFFLFYLISLPLTSLCLGSTQSRRFEESQK